MQKSKIDRRVKYTKQQLSNSLIELMGEKPLYKISIKEICDKADINRSTFYSHYETQYDLYGEIVRNTADDIKKIIDLYPSKKGAIDDINLFRSVLKYTENNRELCLVLLSDKGNLTVGKTLSDVVDSFVSKKSDEDENASELHSYISLFILSGMASILWKWLSTEDRISADKLAMLIFGMLSRGTRTAELIKSVGNSEPKKAD